VQGCGGKDHLRHARCLLYAAGKPGDPTWRAGSIPQYGIASDTTDGSKNVKISNKEVGLKINPASKKVSVTKREVRQKRGLSPVRTEVRFFSSHGRWM
jgi:hypothetical protein